MIALVLGIVLSSESAFGPLTVFCLFAYRRLYFRRPLSQFGVCCFAKQRDQKHLWEERVYFLLKLSGCSPSLRRVKARTQGRNLEAGTDARL